MFCRVYDCRYIVLQNLRRFYGTNSSYHVCLSRQYLSFANGRIFTEGYDQKRRACGQVCDCIGSTSREEIGNPVHQGTRKKLAQDHISAAGKYAVQLTKEDYEKYDLILGMDRANISNILRIIGSDPQEKVHRLLDFTELPRDIADPWYTGDFEITYAEIKAGCAALLKHLRRF